MASRSVPVDGRRARRLERRNVDPPSRDATARQGIIRVLEVPSMKLHKRIVALAAALGFLLAPVAFAQTPAPAAPAAPAAPRKLISPFRGAATVEFTAPVSKRTGANIVTTMTIKNTSPGPLAGFRLEESWSD